MPFRDAATTLEEALGSVLDQRDCNLELVAVDDGSADGGADLVGRLAARHRQLRLFAGEARGIAAALNLGLSHCRAPFVARMDADDIAPTTIWGAGRAGRHFLRALIPLGVRAERFIDIDPRKIGGHARGVPIVGPDDLPTSPHGLLLVSVAARGARDRMRHHLQRRGYREGRDFVCTT